MKKIEFYSNKNIISKRLKQARKAKKFSQSELAIKLQLYNVNMDQQMISKIESNSRIVTDYELACFCHILNVEPNQILQPFYSKIDWK